MSAFVVGTDHIDYLVTAVNLAGRDPYGIGSVTIADPTHEATIKEAGGADGFQTSIFGPLLWMPDRALNALGRMLIFENIHSVQTRYGGEPVDELPGPRPMPVASEYSYRSVPRDLITPAQTIQAIACWQYQTCEYTGHENAPGWQTTERLYRAAVRELIGEDRTDLAWEWSRPATPAGA